ncbi:MAG TPA: asparagine synthase-related protein [Pyrinomonadaceae bacterium]|nr:asparagine synthase-related protein [Pyrinomonadaceae bacterium]
MSAIGGIFNFRNKPVDPDLLSQLWVGLSARGPDGGNVMIDGAVGLCYRAFHTNRESRLERQPFLSKTGFTLVVDGRIDNRNELLANLGDLEQKECAITTDVEIAMAAFLKWGDDFASHIVGEFALAVWDPRKRRLLLGRDHIGARTLYFHKNEERLIFSSELKPLLDVTGTVLEIDDEYIAGYLVYDPEPDLTPYSQFKTVKPFHLISVTGDGKLRSWPYWSLNRKKEIRYAKDEDYEADFLVHFKAAVSAPLRSDLPVCADLSGGLDSSAIVCVADELINNGNVPAPRLETVSHVTDSSPTSDERTFIRYVEEQRGRASHHIVEDDYPLLSLLSVENATRTLNPLLFCAAQHRAVHNVMQKCDARVLLSGMGGDEITCAHADPSPQLADLLVRGELVQLHSSLKAWSAYLKKSYPELLWRNAFVPTLPRRIQLKLKSVSQFPTLFAKDFSRRMHLLDRLYAVAEPFKFTLPSDSDQALGFWTATRGIASGTRREMSKVDVSYPFLHRPFVEFMQAIPHTQRVRVGQTRSLMRRSLMRLLPETIAKRKSKGNPQEVISRAIAREWPRLESLFVDARVVSRGYIDRMALRSTIEKFRFGCGTHSPALLKTLVLEVWLRGLERQAATVKQPAAIPREYLSQRFAAQTR